MTAGERLGWLLLSAALCADAPSAHGQSALEDQPLILEVTLSKVLLSDGMLALQRSGQVFVPLTQFCDALEFAIRVTPQTGAAEGWFLEEGRTFQLDVPRGTVRIRDQEIPFEAIRILQESEDLFIETGLLSSWFPVDLAVDPRNLLLRITSREPLPIEQRLAREQRRERARQSRQLLERPSYPRAAAPYGWLGWPFCDLAVNAGYRRSPSPTSAVAFSAFTTADLLGLGAQWFLAGDRQRAVSETLLRAGRTDPEAGLLGPLRATEFSLGDVFTPQSSLVAQSRKGRGVTLSNVPLDRPSEFDRTTLRGEGVPGWEVELYRNGALLDWGVVGPDGRYEFPDVSVLYGLNLFGIVLYGPQGQRREESRRYWVGPDLIEPGRGYYRLAANQHQTDLCRLGGDDEQRDGRSGAPRLSVEYERGLHQRLSAGVSLARLPLEEDRQSTAHTYVGTVLHGSLGSVCTAVNGAADVAGGWGGQAALQTRWHGINLLGEYGRFRDYRSERISEADPQVRRSRARVDGGTTFAVPVSWSLESAQERRQSGRIETNTGNRLSFSLPRVLLTNELAWRRRAAGPADAEDWITGQALLNSRMGGVLVRTALRYSCHPIGRVLSVALSADRRSPGIGRTRLGVDQELAGRTRMTYSVGWTRTFEELTLGLDGSSSSDGAVAASLSLSFSLGRGSDDGAWRLQGQPLAASGVARARVVLDKNGNGRADPDDEPVPGARFRVSRSPAPGGGTNEQGEMLITGLNAHRPTDVSVNADSFEDPFWVVRPEGFSVLPRPGGVVPLEFLVQETGAIDGTVFIREDSEVRVAPAVPLELRTAEGDLVRTASSSLDGFFIFDMVPHGRYLVTVAAGAAARMGLTEPSGLVITVDPESPVQSGGTLILERAPGRR